MATRGIFQLQKLTLHFCEVGGSSRAMREYLGNGKLVAWATNHPHVNIVVQQRNGHHPYILAQYLTGPQKSTHQVTVKNYESWNEVEEVVEMLSNRSGRKITKLTKPVLTDTPSIQGVWTPFLNLQHEPPFEIEIIDGNEDVISSSRATSSSI